MGLDIKQIYDAAVAAGFTPDQATTWTAIALAESGGDPHAFNGEGERSVGLWQINLDAHTNVWGNLEDPYANARAAYAISSHGTDFRPWTTTHASHAGTGADYRTYLDDVSEVTGYAGDGRGVEGYRSPLPQPLPASQPPAATEPATVAATPTPTAPATSTATETQPLVPTESTLAASDAGSTLDADQDGLTDAFERMIGSRVDLADSDSDGLSDTHEAVVTRTDPTRADTDDDTLTDSNEVAFGTSPTAWDSDVDGASDGVELQYGKDPLVAENGTVRAPAPAPAPAAGQALPVETVDATTQEPTAQPTGTLRDAFVELAKKQAGDEYVFGAPTSLGDKDPEVFDCSSLTMWAARQVGVEIQDGTWNQYLDLKAQGQTMSVEEALNTKGALLFYFSSEPTPGGGRPSQAHVAISLGDGRTIEAQNSENDVGVFDGGGGRFNFAGMIPEIAGSAPAPPTNVALAPATPEPAEPSELVEQVAVAAQDLDSDDDGLSDEFERLLKLEPLSADSDGDGRTDAEEILGGEGGNLRQLARKAALAEQDLQGTGDEDSDGLSNRYELDHGLDALNADSDADGLIDSSEVAYGTDPRLLDTDMDGVTDKSELELGTNPLKAGAWLDAGEPDLTTTDEPAGVIDDGPDIG